MSGQRPASSWADGGSRCSVLAPAVDKTRRREVAGRRLPERPDKGLRAFHNRRRRLPPGFVVNTTQGHAGSACLGAELGRPGSGSGRPISAASSGPGFKEEQLRAWHARTGKGPADHPLLQADAAYHGFAHLTKDEAEAIDVEHLYRSGEGDGAEEAA